MQTLTRLASLDAATLCVVLDQAELGLLWVDEQARIRHANRYVLDRCGPVADLRDCFAEISDAHWQALLAPAAPAAADGFHAQLRLRTGDLESYELQLQSPALALADGSAAGLRLLTLRPMGERAVRESLALLQRQVLEAVALGRALPQVMEMLCRRVETLAPDVICSVLAVDAQGRLRPLAAPSLPAAYSQALDGLPIGPVVGSCGTAAWRKQAVEVRDIAQDPLWAEFKGLALAAGLGACWSTPILLDGARVAATFALYYREPREVAPFHRRMVEACAQLCSVALKHDEHLRQIERLAYFDEVTGLPNRSLFHDRLGQALPVAMLSGSPAALLLLDLDRFKTVNESFGHATGDEVLCQVAARLQAGLREADTLARFGGDEFVAWLPGCSGSQAMQVADKLLAALQPPLQLPNQAPLLISASIGISCFPEDGQDPELLFKNADIAMYEAKRAGRNCARFFLPAMNQALDERLALEAALRQALAAEALRVVYQPKLRLRDGRVLGAEALLRWTDARAGEVAPDQFIPVAEECGLVNALDAWVLEQVCAQLARWREAGLALDAVSVNVSPTRFQQDDVVAHLSRLLAHHGLRPEQLTLEVTERLLLQQDERTADQLARLFQMGVRISLDDFGTGYSSLSYLKRLPVSELKLDRSFVRDLETDADDRALASAVLAIGRALGLSVVAEGVETEGQGRILIELGCEEAQGYGFARPMSAAALQDWMAARR